MTDIQKMREALEWYATQARLMGNAAIQNDSASMLALMKIVAVDYGDRARAALKGGDDAQE